MAEESQEETPVTEVTEATTVSNIALPKQKKERTEKQKEALQKAREKAFMKRQEDAELKRKQKEIDRAILARAREEQVAKVEQMYQEVSATKFFQPLKNMCVVFQFKGFFFTKPTENLIRSVASK